jgi:hypothetical protein
MLRAADFEGRKVCPTPLGVDSAGEVGRHVSVTIDQALTWWY